MYTCSRRACRKWNAVFNPGNLFSLFINWKVPVWHEDLSYKKFLFNCTNCLSSIRPWGQDCGPMFCQTVMRVISSCNQYYFSNYLFRSILIIHFIYPILNYLKQTTCIGLVMPGVKSVVWMNSRGRILYFVCLPGEYALRCMSEAECLNYMYARIQILDQLKNLYTCLKPNPWFGCTPGGNSFI